MSERNQRKRQRQADAKAKVEPPQSGRYAKRQQRARRRVARALQAGAQVYGQDIKR